MEKIEMEYNMNVSPRILFIRLSTADGMAEWFADEVNVNENVFTFIWNGAEQKAEQLKSKKEEFVQYQWLDGDEDTYFEFKLQKDELTGELALIITDFAEPNELEDARNLWDSHISHLKHILGM